MTGRCCVLSTADGSDEVRHCEPLHRGPGAVAGDDVRLLAHDLGTEVVADCHVDDRVRTGSDQMPPVLAGAVRWRHAVWGLHCHRRQGRHYATICLPRLHAGMSVVRFLILIPSFGYNPN